MRVMINGVTTVKAKTGVGHYTACLHEALVRLYPADRFDCYPSGWERRLADFAYRRLTARAKSPQLGSTPSRRGSALRSIFALLRDTCYHLCREHFRSTVHPNGLQAPLGRFDLYHEPNYIPWPCDLPTVASVHDLSVLLHPQWHPAERVKLHEQRFYRGLPRCAELISGSDFTKSELIARLGVSPERITTIPYGIRAGLRQLPESELLPALGKFELRPGYFLYVGTLEPRKNILTLLKAYGDLSSSVRARCPLVLCGGWGWKADELKEYIHTTARHQGVISLGYVPDEALPALYNGARALVYPSFYEGFGLPLAEMQACGGAVIASTAGAHREVLGPEARLIPPEDVVGWRDAMHQAATDAEYVDDLRAGAITRASRFTWESAARLTVAVYRRVLSGTGSWAEESESTSGAAPDGPPRSHVGRVAA